MSPYRQRQPAGHRSWHAGLQTLAAEAQPFTADFLCVFYDALHDDRRSRFSSTSISRCGPAWWHLLRRGDECRRPGRSGSHRAAGCKTPTVTTEQPPSVCGAMPPTAQSAHCRQHCTTPVAPAGCPNWSGSTGPGAGRAVIEGLRRIVSDRCPIIGGSSADDDIGGRWRRSADGPLCDGLVVGVLFPSGASATSSRVAMNPAVQRHPSPASAPPPPRAGGTPHHRHRRTACRRGLQPLVWRTHSSRSSLRAATSSGPRPCFRSRRRCGQDWRRCAAIG